MFSNTLLINPTEDKIQDNICNLQTEKKSSDSYYETDDFFSVCKLPILSWILTSVGLINIILEDMILCFYLFYLF